MKKLTLLFLLLLLIFYSCKKKKLEKNCCSDPEIEEHFNGGYLVMPNIFTPNGDGQNDHLRIFAKGITKFSIVIKNNGFGKLFESTDYNDTWDGKYKGGKFVEGIFKYEIEAETINGEKIKKEGKICCIINQTEDTCLQNAMECVFGNQWYNEKFNKNYNIESPQVHLSCE